MCKSLQVGYPVVSLHGGKDQMDRESTLNDFKGDVSNLLVATSIAARGLDVKELVLVVNYDPPNHHEDYIHRVGRTGETFTANMGTVENQKCAVKCMCEHVRSCEHVCKCACSEA